MSFNSSLVEVLANNDVETKRSSRASKGAFGLRQSQPAARGGSSADHSTMLIRSKSPADALPAGSQGRVSQSHTAVSTLIRLRMLVTGF